jgi:putative FmdB family regulatory protein
MPLYDMKCNGCGDEPEIFKKFSEEVACALCGHSPLVVMFKQAPSLAGIIFSNAEENKQLGVRFESNAEKREYFKKNPHIREMSKGSADERKFADRLRNKAEKKAKTLGFNDLDDKRRFHDKNRQKGLTTEQAIK